jgi:hypothetical protein
VVLVGVEGGKRCATILAERSSSSTTRPASCRCSATLEADPDNAVALHATSDALSLLLQASHNLNEQGWLNAGIIEIDARLGSGGNEQ